MRPDQAAGGTVAEHVEEFAPARPCNEGTVQAIGGVDVLLIQERANRPAYRCPTDGRVQATAGDCPLDGTPMQEQSDGADLAVHRTLAFGGKVKVIRHHQDLDPVEGIGALLRFPASVVKANG